MKWYEHNTMNASGIIISSRIRLARNLLSYRFPNRLTLDQSEHIIKQVREVFKASSILKNEVDMLKLNKTDQIAMMERHLVSPQFIKNNLAHSIFISDDESVSVMINEEDHIRIQAMESGMNLMDAFEKANEIDDLLEAHLSYACSNKFGYLTSCPTNIGTGMRASFMIHVPALESSGQLSLILEAIGKFGLTVRGIYGEGSRPEGSVFQISNQITIGVTENEIIENVSSVANQIIEQELLMRERLLDENRLELEDRIYRSYGILKNARVMKSGEAMRLLSDIKLGLELNLIKNNQNECFNIFDFMTSIQPANLQNNKEYENINFIDRDILRAKYIRENLPNLI